MISDRTVHCFYKEFIVLSVLPDLSFFHHSLISPSIISCGFHTGGSKRIHIHIAFRMHFMKVYCNLFDYIIKGVENILRLLFWCGGGGLQIENFQNSDTARAILAFITAKVLRMCLTNYKTATQVLHRKSFK
jgi:hypothetical protein